MKPVEILDTLEILFPQAKPELNFSNSFELLIAVILSAQTTDKSVNRVTVQLFKQYPNPLLLSQASLDDVEECLRSIGLYRHKAKHIIACATKIHSEFNDEVPQTIEQLMTLPGVGRKTANVVVSVAFDQPAIAVDTHVERVSKRLKLAYANDSVLDVERKLMRKFPRERWARAHHLMIFFGRYQCTAKNPKCEQCPFSTFCRYYNQNKEKPIER